MSERGRSPEKWRWPLARRPSAKLTPNGGVGKSKLCWQTSGVTCCESWSTGGRRPASPVEASNLLQLGEGPASARAKARGPWRPAGVVQALGVSRRRPEEAPRAEGEGRVEGKAETGAEVPSQERRLPLWSKAGCSLPQPLTAQRWANLQLGRLQRLRWKRLQRIFPWALKTQFEGQLRG